MPGQQPLIIPADRARGIMEVGQAALEQQRELERLHLVQRVRLLEAVLGALGFDLEKHDVTQVADGSLEVKEKAVVEKAAAGGA